MICNIPGCNQNSYGRPLCYYHQKKKDGLISKDLSHLKSRWEKECVNGRRQPDWFRVAKFGRLINRVVNIFTRHKQVDRQELFNEACIITAVMPSEKSHLTTNLYFNMLGWLKTFISRRVPLLPFPNRVFYDNDYEDPISDTDVETLLDETNIPDLIYEKYEGKEQIKDLIDMFMSDLNSKDRKVFKYRLLTSKPLTLRQTSKRLKMSHVNVWLIECKLVKQFKDYLNG